MNELNLQNKNFLKQIRYLEHNLGEGDLRVSITIPTIYPDGSEITRIFQMATKTYLSSYQVWYRSNPLFRNFTFTTFSCIEHFWQHDAFVIPEIDRKKIYNYE